MKVRTPEKVVDFQEDKFPLSLYVGSDAQNGRFWEPHVFTKEIQAQTWVIDLP